VAFIVAPPNGAPEPRATAVTSRRSLSSSARVQAPLARKWPSAIGEAAPNSLWSLGRMAGVGPDGWSGRAQGDPGGPQPPVRGCLADSMALGDLGAAQALVLVQVAQLLTAGRSAAATSGSSGDAGVVQPPSDRRGADPVARRELGGGQPLVVVPAPQLGVGRGQVASSTLTLRAQRDARLLQPDANGSATHPQPLADLGGGQPLLLVEPAQLRRGCPP
jgi:hypothetical protein